MFDVYCKQYIQYVEYEHYLASIPDDIIYTCTYDLYYTYAMYRGNDSNIRCEGYYKQGR